MDENSRISLKLTLLGAALGMWSASGMFGLPAVSRFEKLSEHFYYSKSADGAGNLGILVTGEGVLLIDTPSQKDVPSMLETLRRLTPNPVSWVVNTHFHADHTGGNGYFLEHHIPVIGSQPLRRLMTAERKDRDRGSGSRDLSPSLAFGRQMHLFPGGIDVRVLAVEHKAHTSGDVVVVIPSEKVVQVGDLYCPGSLPEIDAEAGEGSALEWIDAMKQVIEAVPLLRSAMPASKPVPAKTPGEEKTLEELIVVVPGHGPASNLKEMKNLVESVQKLRSEAGRAVSGGRTRESFLASPFVAPYRSYGNLEGFVSQLFDALSRK